jgi:hypothetical protein
MDVKLPRLAMAVPARANRDRKREREQGVGG